MWTKYSPSLSFSLFHGIAGNSSNTEQKRRINIMHALNLLRTFLVDHETFLPTANLPLLIHTTPTPPSHSTVAL